MSKKRFFLLRDIPAPVLLCITALAFFILTVPVVYIGKYDAPSADDYWYGRMVHDYVTNHGINPMGIIASACGQVAQSFRTWQGTYSSIFMMSLCPAAIDYRLYKLVPAIMIAAITLACFALSHAFLRRGLHMPLSLSLSAAFLVSILTVEKVYSIRQGLFWYNGAVHYMFMHSVSFLYAACLMRIALPEKTKAGRILFGVAGVLLGLAVGGANYATIPMTIAFTVLFSAVCFLIVRKRALVLAPAVLALLAGSAVNMLAPGNEVRAAYYTGMGMGAGEAVVQSLIAGIGFLPKYMNLFTLLMLLLLFPVFWNGLRGCTRFSFRFPALFTLLSYGVMCAGFTSSLYTGGGLQISRLLNSVCFEFQILLIANEVYWTGWLRGLVEKKHPALAERVRTLSLTPLYALIISLLMYATVHFSHNPLGTFTTWAAWYHFQVGDAAMYYQEYITRKNILENSAGEDVVLEPYFHRPWLLYDSDITEDPAWYDNEHLARYYGLHSVRLADGG